jgi:UDP-N-acetylglucosamine 4-epimerase
MAPVKERIAGRKLTWLVTGSAGFIGSHLVEQLLRLGQQVVSLDNFATGHRANLREVEQAVGPDAWRRHRFMQATIVDPDACRAACRGVDIVLQGARSVPRSIADPIATHETNVTGFVNMLIAARDAKVQRFVYASSSSAYGDHEGLPKVEHETGAPLSPYAASKQANELYADAFARCYGMQTVGMRYFNVFGPRQDPEGAYAAVIPRWVRAMLTGETVEVNGDGETSRDFCYIANVVQANLLAALTDDARAVNRCTTSPWERTPLNRLLGILVRPRRGARAVLAVQSGDVRHSLADISLARSSSADPREPGGGRPALVRESILGALAALSVAAALSTAAMPAPATIDKSSSRSWRSALSTPAAVFSCGNRLCRQERPGIATNEHVLQTEHDAMKRSPSRCAATAAADPTGAQARRRFLPCLALLEIGARCPPCASELRPRARRRNVPLHRLDRRGARPLSRDARTMIASYDAIPAARASQLDAAPCAVLPPAPS